jgi:hypothetical protein
LEKRIGRRKGVGRNGVGRKGVGRKGLVNLAACPPADGVDYRGMGALISAQVFPSSDSWQELL